MSGDGGPSERWRRVRGLARLVDPAEPGFVRRAAVGAAVTLMTVACLIVSVAWQLAGGATLRYWQGVLLLEVGRPHSAERIARGLIADTPDAWGHYRLLATALRREGRFAEQMAVYDEAAAAFPDLVLAQGHRCWYGALFGQAERVLDSCDRAVDLAGAEDVARMRFWRSAARDLAGDIDGARSDLEASIAAWSSGSQAPALYREAAARWLTAIAAGQEPLDETELERVRRWY